MYKIGVTIRFRDDYYTMCLNRTYYTLLKEGPFELVVITPSSKEHYHWLAKELDALLLTGGLDLDSHYYHQENHPKNELEDPIIDQMDFELIDAFLAAKKPIFGICRGIQVLNVYYQGTLTQDIPTCLKTTIDHSQKEMAGTRHQIQVQDSTFFAHYFENQAVNSFHHQCIDKLGQNLTINAISEDGIIEGIENQKVIAVQWHPERMDDLHRKQFCKMMVDFIERNKQA